MVKTDPVHLCFFYHFSTPPQPLRCFSERKKNNNMLSGKVTTTRFPTVLSNLKYVRGKKQSSNTRVEFLTHSFSRTLTGTMPNLFFFFNHSTHKTVFIGTLEINTRLATAWDHLAIVTSNLRPHLIINSAELSIFTFLKLRSVKISFSSAF